MEPAIYAKYGVDARFVGHPLADRIAMTPDQEAACTALDLPERRHLAILPGTLVHGLIGPDVRTLALHLVVDEAALVVAAVLPVQLPRTVFLAHGEFPNVNRVLSLE